VCVLLNYRHYEKEESRSTDWLREFEENRRTERKAYCRSPEGEISKGKVCVMD